VSTFNKEFYDDDDDIMKWLTTYKNSQRTHHSY